MLVPALTGGPSCFGARCLSFPTDTPITPAGAGTSLGGSVGQDGCMAQHWAAGDKPFHLGLGVPLAPPFVGFVWGSGPSMQGGCCLPEAGPGLSCPGGGSDIPAALLVSPLLASPHPYARAAPPPGAALSWGPACAPGSGVPALVGLDLRAGRPGTQPGLELCSVPPRHRACPPGTTSPQPVLCGPRAAPSSTPTPTLTRPLCSLLPGQHRQPRKQLLGEGAGQREWAEQLAATGQAAPAPARPPFVLLPLGDRWAGGTGELQQLGLG